MDDSKLNLREHKHREQKESEYEVMVRPRVAHAECQVSSRLMRISATSTCLLALVIAMGASGCSRAQGIVGSWQTETVRLTLPGRTNILASYQTVEFLKDGSFTMGNAVTTDGDKRSAVVFTGTYALIDTNHVRLDVAPNQARPSDKIPLTATFSIVGNELEMSKLTTSVVPETQKYRRVKG